MQYTDPLGLAPKDPWYGYNDKAFRDWVHSQKQKDGLPGDHLYSKDEIEQKWKDWNDAQRPRGKGGKSGKGVRIRGARCIVILQLIGIVFDAIDAYHEYQRCLQDPCQCVEDCT